MLVERGRAALPIRELGRRRGGGGAMRKGFAVAREPATIQIRGPVCAYVVAKACAWPSQSRISLSSVEPPCSQRRQTTEPASEQASSLPGRSEPGDSETSWVASREDGEVSARLTTRLSCVAEHGRTPGEQASPRQVDAEPDPCGGRDCVAWGDASVAWGDASGAAGDDDEAAPTGRRVRYGCGRGGESWLKEAPC